MSNIISSQSLKITSPMNKFINREKEISLIENLLKKNRRGIYFSDWIIEFYGIHCIGKSTLLDKISHICTQDNLSCVKHDFNIKKRNSIFPESIISKIKKTLQSWQPDIVKRTLDQLPSLPTEQEWLSTDDGFNRSNLPQKTSHLAGLIHVFLQKQPLVLIFDTIEQAEETDLEWLESFFSRLASERRTRLMIILAGRVDVRWSRFEVRQHSRSWKLSPFGMDDTAQQLLSLDKEYIDLAKEVYHLTSGHPLNNRIVADYLQVLQKSGVTIQAGVVKKYEKQLIEKLRENFIDPVVMKSISSDRLKEAIELIAPLRRFDLDLLSKFIDKFSLPYGGGFGVLVLRGDMIRSQLVAYDEHRNALALDPTVRRILALSMRYFDTERYREVNQFALDFNICSLRQSSGTDHALLRSEILYHRANLLILEGKSVEEVGQLLKQDLLELASQMTLVDLQQLLAEIEKDWELEEMLAQEFNVIRNVLEKIVNQKKNFLSAYNEQTNDQMKLVLLHSNS